MFDNDMTWTTMAKYHREVGDKKLGDVFHYLDENRDKWEEGELRPEELPHYEYDTSLFILNCIKFGADWDEQNQ